MLAGPASPISHVGVWCLDSIRYDKTHLDMPNIAYVYKFPAKRIIKHEITESRHEVSKSLNSCRLFVSPASIKLSPQCVRIDVVLAGGDAFRPSEDISSEDNLDFSGQCILNSLG